MSSNKNGFVSFLYQYAPGFSNDAKYDETIRSAMKKFNISSDDAIKIQTDISKKLVELFLTKNLSEMKHVILTGTAGDGKTFHSREIGNLVAKNYQQKTGQSSSIDWSNHVIDIKGKTVQNEEFVLRVIKDLSELTKEDKEKEVNTFLKLLNEKSEQTEYIFYLICANDGKLIDSLLSFQISAPSLFQQIEEMLVDDKNTPSDEGLALRMYNLSRSNNADNFREIADQISSHRLWQKCNSCAFVADCPIQINRKRLLSKERITEIRSTQEISTSDDLSSLPEYAEGVFVERLAEILELASLNQHHIPIRHLFVLVTNIILGTTIFEKSDNKKKITITCDNIGRIFNRFWKIQNAKDIPGDKYLYGKRFSYDACNPYENALGLNIAREKDRNEYQAFPLIASFGLGLRTNNAINDFLIYGEEYQYTEDKKDIAEIYKVLCEGDEYFGIVRTSHKNKCLSFLEKNPEKQWTQYQGNEIYLVKQEYLDPSENLIKLPNIHDLLCQQRRRLFFSIPEQLQISADKTIAIQDLDFDVWDMTHYTTAREYKDFYTELREKPNNEVFHLYSLEIQETCKKLVTALNRVFTGFYTKDDERLYIPTLRDLGRSNVQRYISSGKSFLSVRDSTSIPVGDTEIFKFEMLFKITNSQIPSFIVRNTYINLEKFEKKEFEEKFLITLDIFQFLQDVANGALAKTISNSSYEDIRDYQAKVALLFDGLQGSQDDTFYFLALNESSKLTIASKTYNKL